MTAAISSIKSAKAEVNDNLQEISVDYLWSHKLAPEHVSGNLVLRDIAITSDERLLLLSDDIESAMTVIDLNQKEPPETHWLDLIENIRGTTSIAVTEDDEIYIGGNVNKMYPSRYSDGYLAQIDINGTAHWEWTFETGPTQRISQIRPLSSSDLIVASSQSGEPHIARFKPKSTGSFQANAYWTTKIGFSVRKGYCLSQSSTKTRLPYPLSK